VAVQVIAWVFHLLYGVPSFASFPDSFILANSTVFQLALSHLTAHTYFPRLRPPLVLLYGEQVPQDRHCASCSFRSSPHLLGRQSLFFFLEGGGSFFAVADAIPSKLKTGEGGTEQSPIILPPRQGTYLVYPQEHGLDSPNVDSYTYEWLLA
jgi:hypothetical protein